MIRLALFEPDIPQNAGAMMRLAASFGVPLDLIEPCGFPVDDRRLRRAAMDYIDHLDLSRYSSWEAYRSASAGRIVLLTTRGAVRHCDFAFQPGDRIMVGRESAGVPEPVHDSVDARIRIPLTPGLRSINVAQAAAIGLAEALRQLESFPQ